MLSQLNKLFYIIAYIIVFGAAVAAGLNFIVIKNKHTLIKRDIDEIVKHTNRQRNMLSQYKAELQNSNNRFLLKDRIRSQNTGLVPIKQADVITIPAVDHPDVANLPNDSL